MQQSPLSPFTVKVTAQPYAPFYPTGWAGKELNFQSQVYQPVSQAPVGFQARQQSENQVQFAPPVSGSSFPNSIQMSCNDNSNLASFQGVSQVKPFVPSQASMGMPTGAAASVTMNSVPFAGSVHQVSPSKLNPFQSMNLHQAHGFVPVGVPKQQQVMLSPIKAPQRLQPLASPQFDGIQLEQAQLAHGGHKSFVERSMYKREMCKNWTEASFCRYGNKCQYAHGLEELSENNPLYLNEQKQGLNDKYKSQNCRQFYREKYCPYGKRCHFRHEYRSFKKIHRHYYMAHLAALGITHEEMLSDSKIAPDDSLEQESAQLETASSDLSFESCKHGDIKVQNADLSTDDDVSSEHIEDFTSIIPGGSRLSIFQALCLGKGPLIESEGAPEKEPELEQGLLKTLRLDEQQETWSESSVEQQLLM